MSWVRHAILHDTVADRIDADGRPLDEQTSVISRPATRIVRCPYSGSRLGGVMNATAMAQIAQHWPGIHSALACDGTVFGAFRVTTAALLAPEHFVRDHPDQPVPVRLSATYKACLGFHQALLFLLLTADIGTTPLVALGTTREFFAWLDRDGFLVGDVEACAGSRSLIEQAFDTLATPRANRPDPHVDEACAVILSACQNPDAIPPGAHPSWLHAAHRAQGRPSLLGQPLG